MADPEPPVDDGLESDFDEEDEEIIRNIGEHELLGPVQAALFRELSQNHERVVLELREKDEALARINKRREDVGVELYGVQQQLAKLQMQLETTHNNCNLIAGIRQKFEEDVRGYQEAYKRRKEEVDGEEAKLEKSKAELDALSATLKQVAKYAEEMKSEIAVIRRQTYKTEENVEVKEKAKVKQDLYIDSLTEQIKTQYEKLALLDAQLESQRAETTAAAETLAEASREMETINFEKKQLLQQWKSSLVAMQRRDEALQATNDALLKQQQASKALDSEMDGFKVNIHQAQVENSELHEQLDKVANEANFLTGQLDLMKRTRDGLAERYGMLQKSLAQTDKESSRLLLEKKNLEEQTSQLEQNRQVVDRERRALEDNVAANRSTQTTVSKAARNLAKSAQKVQNVIHAKDMERANMENEAARIRLDALNTEAHNAQLQEGLSGLVAGLRDKDQLIEKYELEIRQRNDEIEKKMYLVDRLNRKFEQLTANVEDENMGPLEATIKNLGKNITAVKQQSEELQRQWLKQQTVLVDATNDTETKHAKVREQESQLMLLNQKRLRLDSAIKSQHSEIAALRKNIDGMHNETVRINKLISKNEALYKKLADTNFAMEKEFVESLREMEEAAIRAEAKLAGIKEEKARLLEDILEAERQVMMWEKKIQLEKETQAALDPEVGQAEVKAMEKEIHRMTLRYDTLKRDQERMIKEMERAIVKHEAIAQRFRGRKQAKVREGGVCLVFRPFCAIRRCCLHVRRWSEFAYVVCCTTFYLSRALRLLVPASRGS